MGSATIAAPSGGVGESDEVEEGEDAAAEDVREHARLVPRKERRQTRKTNTTSGRRTA